MILISTQGVSYILKLPIYTPSVSGRASEVAETVFDQARVASPRRSSALEEFVNSFELESKADGAMYEWSAGVSIDVGTLSFVPNTY